jgi:hypothetical protein
VIVALVAGAPEFVAGMMDRSFDDNEDEFFSGVPSSFDRSFGVVVTLEIDGAGDKSVLLVAVATVAKKSLREPNNNAFRKPSTVHTIPSRTNKSTVLLLLLLLLLVFRLIVPLLRSIGETERSYAVFVHTA